MVLWLSGARGSGPAHSLQGLISTHAVRAHSFFGSLLPSSPSAAGGGGGGPMYVGTPSMDAVVAHLLGSGGPSGVSGDLHLRQNTRVRGWGGAGVMLKGVWTDGRPVTDQDVGCACEWDGQVPHDQTGLKHYIVQSAPRKHAGINRARVVPGLLQLALGKGHVCTHH